MSLYVYGIAAHSTLHLDQTLTGISGSQVRLATVENLDVVVSDWTAGAPPIDRENIQAHSQVLDDVLSQTTPLPFRFGIIVRESELAEFIKNNAQSLLDNLKQVEGCVQMSVKILIPSDNSNGESDPAGKTESGPGLKFLRGKYKKNLAATETASWLEAAAGGFIRSSAVEVESDYHLLVRVSHLVPRENMAAYRERMREAFESRGELRGIRSGPWPPYSFVTRNVRKSWVTEAK